METPAGTGLSPPTVHGDQSGLLRDILASHRTAGTASGKAGAFDATAWPGCEHRVNHRCPVPAR